MLERKIRCDICHEPLTVGKVEFVAFEFASPAVGARFRTGDPFRVERHICRACVDGLIALTHDSKTNPDPEGRE